MLVTVYSQGDKKQRGGRDALRRAADSDGKVQRGADGCRRPAGGGRSSAKLSGRRVRISSDARTVIDGPFDSATELAAGFWIWKVGSMYEAVEWAGRCPAPMPGEETQLEIRPLFEMENFGNEMTPELRERETRLRAEPEGKAE